VVNDAYNANPASMAAALKAARWMARDRRCVAVLGEMAELGPSAAEHHREMGHLARSLGVRTLVAVGKQARGYLEGGAGIEVTSWAPTAQEAVALVEEVLEPGDAVLVKGSRAVGLELVAEALTAVRA
jgi:UDP-N-acetylmuramoyl-tripeptide--D-alanyl-D-alanine ligase